MNEQTGELIAISLLAAMHHKDNDAFYQLLQIDNEQELTIILSTLLGTVLMYMDDARIMDEALRKLIGSGIRAQEYGTIDNQIESLRQIAIERKRD